eukprot:CAMPEP_0170079606 /NCGR_PEP_ID=MMETSP0019_2-20121128/15937_1 /TAXON_ID=98059 /ORGANISM="Dinobryon sp., Strain UTEXLB2267" /LENGTH=175 /DNA_ID=CAMNT_0010293131 /DNA_START=264 /DNA_END=792 /DNA_ORIENTATION=-
MQNYRYSWNCRHWQEFVLFGGAEIIAWNSINLFPDKTRKDLALPPRGREQLDASIVLFADMETTGPLGCVPHLHFIQASRYYKELIKNGWEMVMPNWSADEQADYVNSPQFEREYGKEVAQRANNISSFGGSIRSNIQVVALERKDPVTNIDSGTFTGTRRRKKTALMEAGVVQG